MSDGISAKGGGQPTPEKPQKPTLAQSMRFGLPMGLGIGVGLVARDATRETLGWWSVVVCMLAAGLAALAVAYVMSAWRRR